MRDSVKVFLTSAASGDLEDALIEAYHHLKLSSDELAQAISTVEQVERWVNQSLPVEPMIPLSTHEAARRMNVTIDSLRTWERNDLIQVPRNPDNGYRQYAGVEILRLQIIRMLRFAGYSLMAIYRMLKKLDSGQTRGLEQILDTPDEGEDFFCAADRWITTLKKQEEKAKALIKLLEIRIDKKTNGLY
jgi:DNA-binding transcriptional MerR regulator